MLRTLLSVLLSSVFAATALAGEPPAARVPARKAAAAPVDAEVSEGQFVFQMLLGEMALQRGDPALAASAYADLARRTEDLRLIERAVEMSSYARQGELTLDMARLWVDKDPASAKARQTLAGVLLMNNRIDELAPQLTTLLSQEPAGLVANLMGLNRLLSRATDKQAAWRVVHEVSSPYLDMPEAQFARALAAYNANDLAAAQVLIEQAQRLRPDWEVSALLEAQILLKANPGEAVRRLEGFVGRNPGARDARLQLARLLIGEKRYSDARDHFERLLKDNPDSPEVIHPVAMLALQQGDADTARKLLERLLTLDIPDKGGVHYFLGQLEEDRKQYDQEVAHYQEVISGDQYLAARARMANVLAQQGRLAEARNALQTSAARNTGERVQLILSEAQLLREARQPQAAFDLIKGALVRYPDHQDLLYDGALVAEKLGKLDQMESWLRTLLAKHPKHAHGLNALGYSYAERNIRLGEAYELISKALAQAPEDPFIMDSLGWVLFRQGKLDEALATLTKAYAIKPDPEIAAHLGEVLWQLGRRDEATSLWRKAQAEHPGSDPLNDAIKRFLP